MMSLLKIIVAIILGYACFVLYAYLTQRQMIYFPDQRSSLPREAGVPEMNIVSFKTRDNLSLSAWYSPPKDSNQPTIIYLHGNAGNIADRAPLVKPYIAQGFGVLLVTYRGYSGNPGIPTEYGLYNDARGAVRFIEKEQDSPCIFLMGNSIGAAVAMQMAVEPELPIKGLILQSPFTSLVDIGKYHYWYLPVEKLAKDKYDAFSRAERVKVPTLVIQGTADSIVPPEFGRKLYDALPEPKEVHEVYGKDHNTLFEPVIVIDFVNKYACANNQ
jgi:pimeloyl-ACP methyl ester carboxylesterase